VISGAKGFVGTHLAAFFKSKGYLVRNLPRIDGSTPVEDLARFLSGIDVIINLAGAPIVGRWNVEYKKTIYDSRIITTRKIVEAIRLLEKSLQCLFRLRR